MTKPVIKVDIGLIIGILFAVCIGLTLAGAKIKDLISSRPTFEKRLERLEMLHAITNNILATNSINIITNKP